MNCQVRSPCHLDATPAFLVVLARIPRSPAAEAVTVIDYYACRWQIEILFKVLKSGCQVEKLQLETEDRLKPCLLLYRIVAWRVLFVTCMGRECPGMPCDVLFADEEWKAVWAVLKRQLLPAFVAEVLLARRASEGFSQRPSLAHRAKHATA